MNKCFPFLFIWSQNMDAFQIVTVQINYFWEWVVGHMAERPRISGTIIQSGGDKDSQRVPRIKKDIKKKWKIIMSTVNKKYKLASQIKKFREILP